MSTEHKSLVLAELERSSQNGHAFETVSMCFAHCRREEPTLSSSVFRETLLELVAQNRICCEGERLYLEETWQNEEAVSERLSGMLLSCSPDRVKLPETMAVGNIILDGEQRAAVEMALSNRISCIIGGAGSGKSTLIRAIIDAAGADGKRHVLCAPTGKAVQNLRQKTEINNAATIHRVLRLRDGGHERGVFSLKDARLVIVDESSMLTLELMARLLERIGESCRIVLLGDPNQMLGIGAGNILPDLRQIGVPAFTLTANHRQSGADSALFYNVSHFGELAQAGNLRFDDSFAFCETTDFMARQQIIVDTVRRRNAGESVQVLTPRRDGALLSAAELNRSLQAELNPDAPGKACCEHAGKVFRAGDPVMVTANDASRNCFNGDIGKFSVLADGSGFFLTLSDWRRPRWTGIDRDAGLGRLELAYAMTIYKSQGSEFDTVLIPLPQSDAVLTRNLLYTAISRARYRVIVYGSVGALEKAMRTYPQPRCSALAEKTLLRLKKCA